MRATEGKDEMGKRFAIVIGVAAVGVMALGAQTAAGVVKYDTELGPILLRWRRLRGERRIRGHKVRAPARAVPVQEAARGGSHSDPRSHFISDPGFSGYVWEGVGTEVFSTTSPGRSREAKVRRKVHDR